MCVVYNVHIPSYEYLVSIGDTFAGKSQKQEVDTCSLRGPLIFAETETKAIIWGKDKEVKPKQAKPQTLVFLQTEGKAPHYLGEPA